jgi:broad specificity phosphatase PhoE
VDGRPTVIYLLRHGEVVLAERRRFVGHLDVPLSPHGEAQCARQAERLRRAGLAAVFTSDLGRAYRSGEIIGAPHGLRPETLPALREMDMGRWDGLTAAELEAREPEAFKDWMARVGEYPFPGGEDVPRLAARAWPAFEAIARAYAGRAVAIVAHAGPNRAILCRALELPLTRLIAFGQDYAGLTVLEGADARWRLTRLNEGPVMGGIGSSGADRRS